MAILERNTSLSYQVTAELGRSIVRGDFRPDDALPTEAKLCDRFGVSRTAVREAVKMLAAKGLLTSKPRRGIRVQPVWHWNIFDPDLLNWSLETEPTLQVMNEFFQLRVAVEPEAAFAADLDFHVAILYATRNRFYIRLRDFIHTALNVTIHFTTPAVESYEEILAAHEKILRAIEQGDVEQARHCMRTLIVDAHAVLEAQSSHSERDESPEPKEKDKQA
ncbi:MAG: FadR/GntR family transcriptional regulator [Woeseiaceae bacterium]